MVAYGKAMRPSLVDVMEELNAGGGGSYTLPTASADTLGGVKVGSGLAIDSDGVLSASGGSGSSEPNTNLVYDESIPGKAFWRCDLPISELIEIANSDYPLVRVSYQPMGIIMVRALVFIEQIIDTSKYSVGLSLEPYIRIADGGAKICLLNIYAQYQNNQYNGSGNVDYNESETVELTEQSFTQ